MADKTWQNGEILPADDFNRWEQNIAEYNSSFTAKTLEDENVPGTSEWNRIEDGILGMGDAVPHQNIARGTNAGNDLVSTDADAAWSLGGWRRSSTNSDSSAVGTRSVVEITDPPVSGIKYGWEIIATGGSTNSMFISQRQVPVEIGETYVISCYTKGTGTIRMQIGYNNYSNSGDLAVTDDWALYSYKYTMAENRTSDGTTNIYFGVGSGQESSVQICAVKFEVGDAATEWNPNPHDVFEPNTIEDDTLIDADEANHIEQGIEDMINYAETYKDTSEADATPQSIPDDTEDDGNVAAPEAEEIE